MGAHPFDRVLLLGILVLRNFSVKYSISSTRIKIYEAEREREGSYFDGMFRWLRERIALWGVFVRVWGYQEFLLVIAYFRN
jgi:hypothetical protein